MGDLESPEGSPGSGTGWLDPGFTNTAVPKVDGTVCWQQHLQVYKAIAKSNGW